MVETDDVELKACRGCVVSVKCRHECHFGESESLAMPAPCR